MLHHISLGVRNLPLSGTFYDAALQAIGFRRVFEHETAIGYGLVDGEDILCLKLCPDAYAAGDGFHLAFAAKSTPPKSILSIDRRWRSAENAMARPACVRSTARIITPLS